MEKSGKIILVGAVAVGALMLTGAVKAGVDNAVAGQPQFLVKGFNISKGGGVVHLAVVNPGNQSYTVNSIVANIMDNGTRLGMINFTPGPGNPAVIPPASTTNIDLTVVPDPIGIISDALSSGQQLVQDVKQISNQAQNGIQTASNLITTLTSLFGGTSSNINQGANNAPASDGGITTSAYSENTNPLNEDYNPDSDPFINTGIVDPNSVFDPTSSNYGNFNSEGGGEGETGLGAAGDQHVLTMQATINLSGINIQLTQPLASVSQALS